jgi:methionyl-tRNA synthetase
MPNKFYLTTPIYYVNARPHIGHAYSTIAADVIARRHRLLGDDTFFLTGTDEHGQKVQRASLAAGVSPQEYADEVSASFQNLWKRMGITNDDYIRTTAPRHKRGVQHLWRVLEERGAIYLSSYTGQYCVSDEAFVDVPVGAPCPTCGRITETITEENYFFKLSAYQEKLIDLVADFDRFRIEPFAVRNEVLQFLSGNYDSMFREYFRLFPQEGSGPADTEAAAAWCIETGQLKRSPGGMLYVPGAIRDLSISRTTFDWGIPVPGNPKHVIYVWLDALANYITAIGYGSDDPADKAKFEKYWPADIHLVGKEITRFHCVYWPAFLMAAGIATPKSVVANGWLLFEESKMSKSRGNVVRTETILDAFGPLCPPVPNDPSILENEPSVSLKGTASAVPSEAAHIHAALAAEGTPGAPDALGSSSGLQPAGPTPKDAGALAPGLAAPTKAQQDLFAADVLRYFLLREIPFGQDGSFSFDALITRYNADLANGYGNLVSRTLSMIEKYLGGEFRELGSSLTTLNAMNDKEAQFTASECQSVKLQISDLPVDVDGPFDAFDFAYLLTRIWRSISEVDVFITGQAPWRTLVGLSEDVTLRRRIAILSSAAESIRIITALLYPVMPYATASVWRQLGLGDIEEAARNGELKNLQWGGLKPGTKLGPLAPIFPRADKGLAQIMTDMENPTTPAAAEPAKPAADPSAPTAEALNAVNPATAPPAPGAEATPGISPAPTDNSQLRTENSPTITIDDFAKVDLRVAQIVVAERIPKADKLLRLEVDLGPNFDPPRRQILAGIAEHYAPEALIGRKVVIVANLAPRKMRGLESNGMIVAASVGPNGAPVLVGFIEDVELGARLK